MNKISDKLSNTNYLVFLLFLLSLLTASLAYGSNEDSAKSWMTLIDHASYGESWQEAAPFFKANLTESKWHDMLTKIRTPLGKVISRELQSKKPYNQLPGVPDGEYVVIKYKTAFSNKQLATETLTMVKLGNNWQTIGYYIN